MNKKKKFIICILRTYVRFLKIVLKIEQIKAEILIYPKQIKHLKWEGFRGNNKKKWEMDSLLENIRINLRGNI